MTDAALPELARLGIGKVLDELRGEFPELSISKIRYLESEGLLEPQRTPSGYRKFSFADVERLRFILRQQARQASGRWATSARCSTTWIAASCPTRARAGTSRVPAPEPWPTTACRWPRRSARAAASCRLSREELLESAGIDSDAARRGRGVRADRAPPHPDLLRRRRPPGRRAGGGVRRARPRAAAPAPLRAPRPTARPSLFEQIVSPRARQPRPGGRRPRRRGAGRAVRAAAHRPRPEPRARLSPCARSRSSGFGSRCPPTSRWCCCASWRATATCRSGSARSRRRPSRSPSRAPRRHGR